MARLSGFVQSLIRGGQVRINAHSRATEGCLANWALDFFALPVLAGPLFRIGLRGLAKTNRRGGVNFMVNAHRWKLQSD